VRDRVRIIDLASQGCTNEKIASALDFSEARVGKWRSRFAGGGLPAIVNESPRSGRPAAVRLTMTSAVLEKTLSEEPPEDQKFWSTRLLAKVLGISHTSVHRIWQEYHIQPRKPLPAGLKPDQPVSARSAPQNHRESR
jgi:putative transposase